MRGSGAVTALKTESKFYEIECAAKADESETNIQNFILEHQRESFSSFYHRLKSDS